MPGWLPLLLVGMVRLEGGGACPRAEDVAVRLSPLLPANTDASGRPRHVILDEQEGSLRIRLVDEQGTAAAERHLPRAECADLALAAAVVIAAWQWGDRDDAPAARVPLEPRAEPPPPSPAPAVSVSAVRAPASPRPRFEVAAAYVASIAPGTGELYAPGGMVEVSLGPPGRGLGGRFSLSGSDLRQLPVAGAQVMWTRAALGLGPRFRFGEGSVRLDLHAEFLAALVYMRGEQLIAATSATDFDPGFGLGATLSARYGHMMFFVGASAREWLRDQWVDVGGNSGGHAVLPRFEVLLAAGLGLDDL